MAYTPDATDVDRPTSGDLVEIPAELRAIKQRITEESAGKVDVDLPVQQVFPTGSTGSTANGATAVNLANGTFQHFSVVSNVTFSFTVPTLPANNVVPFFTLRVTGGGNYTVTWPANTRWPVGIAPALSTGTDMLVFYKPYPTADFWEGILIGSNMSVPGV